MKRRELLRGAALGGLACLGGAGATSARASLLSDVKIGMSTPANIEQNGVYVWVRAFADRLEAGGMPTRVYPNSTVGGDRERTIQTQLGLLDVNATGGDELGRWSPMLAAASRPFLVESYAHMSRIIDTTGFLETISGELASNGLRLVDFVYVASMVGLFTRGTPVRTLEELRDLRLRVISEADMHLLRAWQVRGVQVAWEEVAQALQTGIVDAYLNPPNIAPMYGHGSVLDYYTDLRMGPATRMVVASTEWLDGLRPAQRLLVEQAFADARRANRAWTEAMSENDHQALQRVGIEWIDLDEDVRRGWLEASTRIEPSDWERPESNALFHQWVGKTRQGPGS